MWAVDIVAALRQCETASELWLAHDVGDEVRIRAKEYAEDRQCAIDMAPAVILVRRGRGLLALES